MSRLIAVKCRGLVAARRLPVWNSYGPGPYFVFLWTLGMLLGPALSAPASGPVWTGWLWLTAVAAANFGAVFGAYWRNSRFARPVVALLAVQLLASIGTTWWYEAHWGFLFTLLGLTYGAVGSPKRSPAVVVLLAMCGGAVAWWQSGSWPDSWVTALTTFLAGMSTYGFHRLLTVIAELDATRKELACQAVIQERLRFARDLHDLLGHTLSVIVVKSEAIRRLLPGDSAAASQHAGDIEDIGRQALVEVREAVSGYRDTDLQRELDRAKIATDAAGIMLHTDLSSASLPNEVDTLLGWVVREAITNVIRHARASACHIDLHLDAAAEDLDTPHDDTIRDRIGNDDVGAPAGSDRLVRLRVIDDGRGGDPAGGGGGIRGLRERVSTAGGRLSVADSPNGFTLSVELALPQVGEVT